MTARFTAHITGRVQMVMFRDFTRRHATRLDIGGWVRNNSDGSVTVVAEGEKEKLEQMAKKLAGGPTFARVEDVDIDWQEPRHEFTEFSIVH